MVEVFFDAKAVVVTVVDTFLRMLPQASFQLRKAESPIKVFFHSRTSKRRGKETRCFARNAELKSLTIHRFALTVVSKLRLLIRLVIA